VGYFPTILTGLPFPDPLNDFNLTFSWQNIKCLVHHSTSSVGIDDLMKKGLRLISPAGNSATFFSPS